MWECVSLSSSISYADAKKNYAFQSPCSLETEVSTVKQALFRREKTLKKKKFKNVSLKMW